MVWCELVSNVWPQTGLTWPRRSLRGWRAAIMSSRTSFIYGPRAQATPEALGSWARFLALTHCWGQILGRC